MKKKIGFNKVKLNLNEEKEIDDRDIAIIGMSSKFSLADDYNELWKNLRNGVDAVREFPKDRKEIADKCLKYMGSEYMYQVSSYLDDVDKFDYEFFNMSEDEARSMDPHHRLFMQSVYECLDDAGYGGRRLANTRTGVYVAYKSEASKYYQQIINKFEPSLLNLSVLGNKPTMIYGRIAYALNLRGPSLIVDTACSSSLTALHLACQGIRTKGCTAALVGAVKINYLPIKNYEEFGYGGDVGIEAKDFRTRTFDDMADGTGNGEGVVTILIKPLKKAIEDRDNIHAVIKGSFLNQDGTSIGITAPNAAAHEDVMVNAWKDAKVNPKSISYIEAHGTATNLGDPIEIDGIQRAFENYTDKKQFCAIGSVKSNFGHCDNVAGLAGIMKCVLSLENKELPPTINFHRPNKIINFLNTPVYINYELKEWTSDKYPRRCGVSSFGISGTNSHFVLEEAPNKEADNRAETMDIFTISAKSEESLKKNIRRYKKYISENKDINVNDVCYTANVGRGHYNYRIAFLVKNSEEFKVKIESLNSYVLEENNKLDDVFYSYVKNSKTEDKNPLINNEENLKNICKLFMDGIDINFERFYESKDVYIVPLPAYSFEKKACWVNIREDLENIHFIDKANNEAAKTEVDYLKAASNKQEDESFEKPENDLEKKLSEIWSEILGQDKISVTSNFFALGGNSKNAVLLVAKIQEVLKVKLSIQEFLEHPMIRALSEFIKDSNEEVQAALDSNITSDGLEEVAVTLEEIEKNEYYNVENRSLLNLLVTGKIPPVDGVGLVYLKNEVRQLAGMSDEEFFEKYFDNMPMVSRLYECEKGRFAVILLPIFDDRVYDAKSNMLEKVLQALNIAKLIGAKTVSLAGMIPSATNYGKDVISSDKYNSNLPDVTTGHATTVVAIVLTIERILELSNRHIENQCVGFLGLGSIGSSTLKLLLKTLTHPKKIILCDIYKKNEYLQDLKAELINDYGFKGKIEILESKTKAPKEFYEADVIVGATNVTNVLDVNELAPGTIIVDDTSPHCFDVISAVSRFEKQKDILFSEGGVLNTPFPLKETIYIPSAIESEVSSKLLDKNYDPHNIMGCIFSSLLTSKYEEIKLNIGEVNVDDSYNNYKVYKEIGFRGSMPHCGDYILDSEIINKFRDQFGE